MYQRNFTLISLHFINKNSLKRHYHLKIEVSESHRRTFWHKQGLEIIWKNIYKGIFRDRKEGNLKIVYFESLLCVRIL